MGKQWLWLSLLIVVLDQASKIWAQTVLPSGTIVVTQWFNLALAYNYGAAWSFLADAGGWQRWVLALIALGVSGYLIWWLWRLPAHERVLAPALSLILGGAVGNLIDRVYLGYVVDFVQWHYWGSWYFPTFNIADVGITIGAVALLVLGFFTPDDKEDKKDAS